MLALCLILEKSVLKIASIGVSIQAASIQIFSSLSFIIVGAIKERGQKLAIDH